MAANQSAVEDANVLDWGSLAQNCAIANVNKKISRGGIGNEHRTGMAVILKNGFHPEFLPSSLWTAPCRGGEACVLQ